ncbi:MAG: hypothetical protein RL077_2848 [Verrucomicrobiota bacterium]
MVFPVVGGDAPGGGGIILEIVEALGLIFGGELEPDLDDQGAVVGEEALEVTHMPQGLGEEGEFATRDGGLLEGIRMPAACVDGDAAAEGEGTPVAPHEWALALLVAEIMEGKGLNSAGIQPAVEQINDLALARGVVTSDDEQDGEGGGLEADL